MTQRAMCRANIINKTYWKCNEGKTDSQVQECWSNISLKILLELNLKKNQSHQVKKWALFYKGKSFYQRLKMFVHMANGEIFISECLQQRIPGHAMREKQVIGWKTQERWASSKLWIPANQSSLLGLLTCHENMTWFTI